MKSNYNKRNATVTFSFYLISIIFSPSFLACACVILKNIIHHVKHFKKNNPCYYIMVALVMVRIFSSQQFTSAYFRFLLEIMSSTLHLHKTGGILLDLRQCKIRLILYTVNNSDLNTHDSWYYFAGIYSIPST